jgi:hypothetical protein
MAGGATTPNWKATLMPTTTPRAASALTEELEPRRHFSAVMKRHHADWFLRVRPDGLRADVTVVVGLTPDKASVQVVVNGGPPAVFPLAATNIPRGVGSVRVEGGRGSDHLTVDDSAAVFPVKVTLSGGRGDDVLTAGPRSPGEVLEGGPGNDQLVGGAGTQVVAFKPDWYTLPTDHVLGDTLRGDTGDDVLTGAAGMDVLDGGDGNDTLTGGGEDDTLEPQRGNDVVTGGAGADVFYVGRHPDRRPGLVIDVTDEDAVVRLDHPRHFSDTLALEGVPIWEPPIGF